MTSTAPIEPRRPDLDPDDPKTQLQLKVKSALLAIPGEFSFPNAIAGVNATDLFGLNSILGSAIEVEVVRTLNKLRDLWDPDGAWLGYRFERSSQAFPDVRLVRRDVGETDIALGIELKGWWLFAKEGVPSLRYQVAPAACAPHDLVCVVPWHLSEAVSGTAAVTEPWIESARFAAEWRDHWWQHVREAKTDASVTYPPDAKPYPTKAEMVTAVPAYDGGNNFGRLPRARPLMDDFIERSKAHEVLGIPVRDWVGFLSLHTDTASSDDVLTNLQAQLERRAKSIAPGTAEQVLARLDEIAQLLKVPTHG